MHRYQRVFFDEMERQRGAQLGGPALGRAAHLDRDRRGLPDGGPGRGVAGGPPAPVVAEHGPRLCDRRWPSGGRSWSSAARPSGGGRSGSRRCRGSCPGCATAARSSTPWSRPQDGAVAGDPGGAVGRVDLLLPLAGGRVRGAGRGAAAARGTAPQPRPGACWPIWTRARHRARRRWCGCADTAVAGGRRCCCPSEIQAILDGCAVPDPATGEWVGNLRDRLLFALLAETGMRLGEVLGMRISDFVMGRGGTPYVEIVPRADNANGARVKMMRPRRVYVGNDLERLFADYLTDLACRADELGIPLTADDPLLVNLARPPLLGGAAGGDGPGQGRGVAPQGDRPARAGPRTGSRHSHATALLLAGTPEWVVSRRLGHAHVQTTLDLYGWVGEDEALRAAANWKTYTHRLAGARWPVTVSGTCARPAAWIRWRGCVSQLPPLWRGPVIGPGIADWASISENGERRIDLTGLPDPFPAELAWMAHWQALDGTRSSVLAINQLANILRRAAREDHPFPALDARDGLGHRVGAAGLVLRHPMGPAPTRGQPRPAAGRVPLRPAGPARPLPRRPLVGPGRLAPALRPPDPAVGARAAGQLRMLPGPDRPALAARGGQVASGHHAGGRHAALDDRQPGTAAVSAALRPLAGTPSTDPGDVLGDPAAAAEQAAAFRRWDRRPGQPPRAPTRPAPGRGDSPSDQRRPPRRRRAVRVRRGQPGRGPPHAGALAGPAGHRSARGRLVPPGLPHPAPARPQRRGTTSTTTPSPRSPPRCRCSGCPATSRCRSPAATAPQITRRTASTTRRRCG